MQHVNATLREIMRKSATLSKALFCPQWWQQSLAAPPSQHKGATKILLPTCSQCTSSARPCTGLCYSKQAVNSGPALAAGSLLHLSLGNLINFKVSFEIISSTKRSVT